MLGSLHSSQRLTAEEKTDGWPVERMARSLNLNVHMRSWYVRIGDIWTFCSLYTLRQRLHKK
ncbi:predicted protein [Plenodomus lingam JN3]|uniref:Predicted protein n=1 Tax=Leptosphaeria maculans (strain JN3 / isolate v23.1.3 / race Av1-4-5-6-7-8) TaxID=985895 RepID=E4ZHA1_LEPMJ|nr:predicted protein [Plenodomus lingam JN3]CBX90671.1 predicted protein [Plenodomus lingam JN3]